MSSLRIGCTTIDPREAFWGMLVHGIRETATTQNVHLKLLPSRSLAEQIAVIDQYITEGVDALIVGAWDSHGIAPAIRKANAAGVPVIAVVVEIVDAPVATIVRLNDVRGGELAGEFLATALSGSGKLAHIQGSLAMNTAINRSRGFHNAIDRFPNLEVVYEASCPDWTAELAERMMADALRSEPDIQGVFAGNDTIAIGAARAIKRSGREQVTTVVGFDAQPAGLIGIQEGQLAATINHAPHMIGRAAVDAAMRLAAGESLPSQIQIDAALVTPDTIAPIAIDVLRILPSALNDLVESSETQRQLQAEVIRAQQQMIQELSTPIIPITASTLMVPLVGTIDGERAQQITEKLLNTIVQHHAENVIVDITGVPVLDTSVAYHLMQMAQASRLLGVAMMLVGISPAIATTIVQLGIDLSSIMTFRDMQAGLQFALSSKPKR